MIAIKPKKVLTPFTPEEKAKKYVGWKCLFGDTDADFQKRDAGELRTLEIYDNSLTHKFWCDAGYYMFCCPVKEGDKKK